MTITRVRPLLFPGSFPSFHDRVSKRNDVGSDIVKRAAPPSGLYHKKDNT
jgi:hypothetical protein